ncbi:MAG: hypothetical protein IJF83_11025 [Methanobrevibacter sp.]|nr:hypothetical protein [Methanobrevibacter sp.]
MPYVETYYDYDIHRECFRVSDTASYTKTTDTLFQLTNTVSEVINYFTAIFSIDVIRNLGNSKVGIYDNGQLLQLIDFNENTSRITNFSLRLNYNVEHNLEARYFGNDECLASKSNVLPLLLEIPTEFDTYLEFIDAPADGVIFNPSQYEYLTLYLTEGDGAPIDGATIKVYVDGNETPVLLTTEDGECTLSAPQHWSSTFGVHTFRAVYDINSSHLGVEKELTLYLGYTASLEPNQFKYIVGQTPTMKLTAKRYDDEPIANMNMTLWRG